MNAKEKKSMKKQYILAVVIILLAETMCGFAQKSQEKNKSEKEENFKYLFSEALKQKIFGNYRNAVKYFLECEKITTDDAVEYQLSGLFAMAGDRVHAIEYGRKALMHDPGNIWYYYQLASIYQMYEMEDSLLAVYEQITQHFPEMIRDKMNYADLLVNTGQPEKALGIYKELEEKNGVNKEIMQKKAVALLRAGKKEKAIEKIDEAISLFGKDKQLCIVKASILLQKGDSSQAEKIFRQLLKEYPGDREVEKQVYTYFVKKENYGEALNILPMIIQDGTVSPQEKIQFVFEISDKINETDTLAQKKLESILNDLNEQYSGDIRTSLLLINHYSRNDQYDKAKRLLRAILEQYPEYGMGWRQMLFVCDQAGEQDSVIYYGEKARKIFPKDPLYDVYLGYAWLQKGNNGKALEFAQEGIKKVERRGIDYVDKETGFNYRTFLIQFYGLLGEIYKNLGEHEKSDEAFEEGLKLNPEDDMLLNNYSYYLSLRKEKLKKAKKMSWKTVKRNPENPTYLDTYGWVLFQMGKIKDAEKFIKKALDHGGENSPEILEHYGDILFVTERKEEAVKYWKMAIEKGGEKEKLEKKINR
jgi:tetratricopeptide (TPR) repeat protein